MSLLNQLKRVIKTPQRYLDAKVMNTLDSVFKDKEITSDSDSNESRMIVKVVIRGMTAMIDLEINHPYDNCNW